MKLLNQFQQVKFKINLITNIKSAQLTKLILNVPLFILTAQENKSVSEILSNPILDKQREALQNEISFAASELKIPIDELLIKNIINDLKKSHFPLLNHH